MLPSRKLRWSDSLVACAVGGTLLVKLLGFIEDQQAELLDVSEDQLRLRIGKSRWERWWRGRRGHAPIEMQLDIQPAAPESREERQWVHADHSRIDIHVRPLSRGWTPDRFRSQAERVVHRLRRHLMTG